MYSFEDYMDVDEVYPSEDYLDLDEMYPYEDNEEASTTPKYHNDESFVDEDRLLLVEDGGAYQSSRVVPDGRVPTGFFSLPREIRDVIYKLAIIDFQSQEEYKQKYGKKAGKNSCYENPPLTIMRTKSPYFDRHPKASSNTDLYLDRWLYSIFAASKQFAAEFRPPFFQSTTFYLDETYRNWGDHSFDNNFDALKLRDYRRFLYSLGSEAINFRRLKIITRLAHRPPRASRRGLQGFTEEDAEIELSPLRGLLHPDIILFLVVDSRNDSGGTMSYFYCTRKQDGAFTARTMDIQDSELWKAWQD